MLNVASHLVFEPLGLVARWTKTRLGLLRPVRIMPFLGYGDHRRWRVIGRVQEVRPVCTPDSLDPAWSNLRASWHRFRSSHVPGARVIARPGAGEAETRTDENGYFTFELEADAGAPADGPWRIVRLALPAVEGRTSDPAETAARVLVPSARASFGVVSDIDDTVMYSHATDLWRLIRLTLTNNSRTRVPLPGASAFYRLLRRGADGDRENPFYYVSSAAWNLFDLVEDFLAFNGFPEGPLLMREFGILSGRVLRSNHEHKVEKVERIFSTTEALPFLLIGDAGQHDPELYHRIALANPGRVAAIYIRKVAWLDRSDEISRLAEDLAERGVPMHLFDDTLGMARQAIADGFLPPGVLTEIEWARTNDEQAVRNSRPRHVQEVLGRQRRSGGR